MQIEETGALGRAKPKFEYTHRGEEVQRLSQSMGAERNASGIAAAGNTAPRSADPPTDSSSISEEAIQGLNFLDGSSRTASVISGLQQSFQGNTGDQGHSGRESARRGLT